MSSGDRPTRDALPTVEPPTRAASSLPHEPRLPGPAESGVRTSAVGGDRGAARLLTPTSAPVALPRTELAAPDKQPGVFPLNPVPSPPRGGPLATLKRALGGIAKLGLVGLLTYGLMFNFSVVRGSSMSPSIHDGDRILVDHLTFLLQGVRRGDIVVLQYPLDPSVDYIKRVIGLPGDRILIESGHVLVNGRPLDEPYVASPGRGRHAVRVLPDHYFVLGDNRPHSSDSREFGQVHKDLLRGRVDVRVWPFDRAGRID